MLGRIATKFKKVLETLASHDKTEYHKDSYAKMVTFLDKGQSVVVKKKNRLVLKSIISAVEFCSCQGIALRSHWDDAKYLEDTNLNPGNYKALLRFRCDAGDTILAEHLSKCTKNATYHSKMPQYDIIDKMGGMITEKVVAGVNEAKFFSVISDEVQDAASIEQLTFVLRYCMCIRKVSHTLYVVKESFAGFKEQHREMTGVAVASITVSFKLDELGLNCENLRGQGYDRSGLMAGITIGVSSTVLQKYPLATYIHCCSHTLNLSIASSRSVVLVRNMMGLLMKCPSPLNMARYKLGESD